jgi:hypothetical protein
MKSFQVSARVNQVARQLQHYHQLAVETKRMKISTSTIQNVNQHESHHLQRNLPDLSHMEAKCVPEHNYDVHDNDYSSIEKIKQHIDKWKLTNITELEYLMEDCLERDEEHWHDGENFKSFIARNYDEYLDIKTGQKCSSPDRPFMVQLFCYAINIIRTNPMSTTAEIQKVKDLYVELLCSLGRTEQVENISSIMNVVMTTCSIKSDKISEYILSEAAEADNIIPFEWWCLKGQYLYPSERPTESFLMQLSQTAFDDERWDLLNLLLKMKPTITKIAKTVMTVKPKSEPQSHSPHLPIVSRL